MKKDGKWKSKIFGLVKFKKDINRDIKEVVCTRTLSESINYKKIDGWEDAIIDETHRSTKIVGALFYYYGFRNPECNRVLEFRAERNSVAHEGRSTNFDFEKLKLFFDDIIVNIIKKEESTKTK